MAVFTIQGTWNDFFGPLIYLNKPDKFTLALGLAGFRDQAGYVGRGRQGRDRALHGDDGGIDAGHDSR